MIRFPISVAWRSQPKIETTTNSLATVPVSDNTTEPGGTTTVPFPILTFPIIITIEVCSGTTGTSVSPFFLKPTEMKIRPVRA